MISIFIGIIVLLGGALYFFLNPGVPTISPSDLMKIMENNKKIPLIDVREKHEFQLGHFPRAINIPLSQIELLKKKATQWGKNEEIYLYCQSGSLSAIAARQLQKLGFRHVSHLRGGIMNWKGPVKKLNRGGK